MKGKKKVGTRGSARAKGVARAKKEIQVLRQEVEVLKERTDSERMHKPVSWTVIPAALGTSILGAIAAALILTTPERAQKYFPLFTYLGNVWSAIIVATCFLMFAIGQVFTWHGVVTSIVSVAATIVAGAYYIMVTKLDTEFVFGVSRSIFDMIFIGVATGCCVVANSMSSMNLVRIMFLPLTTLTLLSTVEGLRQMNE